MMRPVGGVLLTQDVGTRQLRGIGDQPFQFCQLLVVLLVGQASEQGSPSVFVDACLHTQLEGSHAHAEGLLRRSGREQSREQRSKECGIGSETLGGCCCYCCCCCCCCCFASFASSSSSSSSVLGARPRLHLVQNAESESGRVVREGGSHEGGCNLHVEGRQPPLRDAPDEVEGLLDVAALAPELHQDAEGEGGGLDALFVHLFDQVLCELKAGVPHTSIEQSVEQHRIWLQSLVHHGAQNFKCRL
mmetsp:Transcript_80765/g.168495  ORF Transcript_80765/g.168495 Transcript_80765/m.168495 type:complete len:246 (+) Transcript_80765:565-1302(+)